MEDLGLSFMDSFSRSIGNGADIKFWSDRWLEGGRFKDRFPRLWALEREKKVKLRDRIVPGMKVGRGRGIDPLGVEQVVSWKIYEGCYFQSRLILVVVVPISGFGTWMLLGSSL